MATVDEGLVLNNYVEGPPDFVKETLCRKVGALSRHRGFHRKIGITSSPRARWAKHKKNNWPEMHVIYKSEYREDVVYLECKLIRRFDMGEVSTPGYYYNAVAGGGGRLPSMGPHYVYLLVAPPYTRFNWADVV